MGLVDKRCRKERSYGHCCDCGCSPRSHRPKHEFLDLTIYSSVQASLWSPPPPLSLSHTHTEIHIHIRAPLDCQSSESWLIVVRAIEPMISVWIYGGILV
ncbi:hypothetical protein VPH35_113045 [Triticum aestivum]